jgi:hypothetical protein
VEGTLDCIVATAGVQSDAATFLREVRAAVYGSEGYVSFYRIDDCELTSGRLSLRVSDRRTGRTVYAVSQRRQYLRKVA